MGVTFSFLVAIYYVWWIWFNLPPNDGAYGSPFFLVLLNPFVLTVLIPAALFAGLIMAPVAHFFIKGRDFRRSIIIICGSTLGWITCVLPSSEFAMWVGLAPTMLIALLICRFSPFTKSTQGYPPGSA